MTDEVSPPPIAPSSVPATVEPSAPTQKGPGFISRIKFFLGANSKRTKFLGIIVVAVTLPLIVIAALSVQNLKQKASVSDLIRISDEAGNLITSTASPNIFVDIDLSTSTQWKLPEQPSAYNGLVKKAYASACMESCLDNGNLSYSQCQSNCGETPTATPVPLPTATTAPLPTATTVPVVPTATPIPAPVTTSGITTGVVAVPAYPAKDSVTRTACEANESMVGSYIINTYADGKGGEYSKSVYCGSNSKCSWSGDRKSASCVAAASTQASQQNQGLFGGWFGGGASSQSVPPTPTPTPNILKKVIIENIDKGTGGSQRKEIVVKSLADIAHISWKLNDWIYEEAQARDQNPSTEIVSSPTPASALASTPAPTATPIPARIPISTSTPVPQRSSSNQANQGTLGVSDTTSPTETATPAQATQTQARTVQITFIAADQSVAPVIFPITIVLTKPTLPVTPTVPVSDTANPSIEELLKDLDYNKDGAINNKDIEQLLKDKEARTIDPKYLNSEGGLNSIYYNALIRASVPPQASGTTPTPVACWATTSPSAINLSVGETAKINASVTSGLGTATITKMFFQSYDGAVVTTNPEFSTTLPYSTTVTAKAQGAKQVVAKAYLSDGRICVTTSKTDTDVVVTAPSSISTPTPISASANQ